MICVFVLQFVSLCHASFQTLQDIQQYAQHMPEYPKSDNTNWLQPDFTTFYTEHFSTSLLDRIGLFLGVKKKPMWQASDFQALLLDLIGYREQNGFSGRHIMHITPKPGDRFVIWGDLQGAFHSLTRDLVELERRGILNNNLEIVHPQFSFIFNGNVINRSPYILETLTVVMQLMKNNPDRVFYIRGKGEDRETWYTLGTKEELKAKIESRTSKTIPLDAEIKRFFNTLPLALYLIAGQTEETVKVVRISNYAASTNEIDEGKVSDFFELMHDKRPTVHKIFDRKKSTKKVEIVATIKGEDRSWSYTKTTGLTHLGFESGGIAWSLLSAPTSAYRKVYDFFWDAFSILKVEEQLADWTLTLYNQDVRDKLGFNKSAEFNVVTGFEVAEKKEEEQHLDQVAMLQNKLRDLETELQRFKVSCPVQKTITVTKSITPSSDQEELEPVIAGKHAESMSVRPRRIILGSTGDEKKGLKGFTYAIHEGSRMAFNEINKQGGFRGRKIELVNFDDSYDPNMARKNILRFLNDIGVDLIFNPIGSQNIIQYIDLIKDGKILVLFPQTGTLAIRDSELKYVINFHASYYQEAEVLTRYAVEKTSLRRFAILYQNDSYGIPPRDGALKELQRQGIPEDQVLQIGYNRDDVNIIRQAEDLQKFAPEGIFFFCTPVWAKSLIRHLNAGYFVGKQCFAISQLSTNDFIDFMEKDNGLSFIFTAQTPSPQDSTLPIVKEFRDLAQTYGLEIDVSSLEGYIDAQLFLLLLNKIPEDDPITKEAIIAAAHSIKSEDFKGLQLHYNSQTNAINDTVWLSTQKDENWASVDPAAEGL